jgi:hypothetical protein
MDEWGFFLATVVSMLPLLGLVITLTLAAGILLGALVLVKGLPMGRRGQWLWHPDSPGQRVWVVRGFWGRVWGNEQFASLNETMESSRWQV